VIYRGDVQGVGFRWRTVHALKGLDVTGFVRNEPDGTVRLVVEGEAAAVRDARRRIRDALAGYIRGENESVGEATGEFGSFAIAR